MFGFLKKIFGTAQERLVKKYFKVIPSILAWEEKYQSLTDDELRAKTVEFIASASKKKIMFFKIVIFQEYANLKYLIVKQVKMLLSFSIA